MERHTYLLIISSRQGLFKNSFNPIADLLLLLETKSFVRLTKLYYAPYFCCFLSGTINRVFTLY